MNICRIILTGILASMRKILLYFQEFVGLAKEVFQLKEKLNERNEEIAELKAERSNTKVCHILYCIEE